MGMIAAPKEWVTPSTFSAGWRKPSSGKIPSQFSLRAIFLIDGDQLEGCKIDVSYKRSPNGLSKDAVSFSLLIDNSRVLGVDDKGVGGHPNDIGKGLPHFGEYIAHPHLHLPVPEASYGYAIPLDPSMTCQELWTLFLEKANVVNAPLFERPPAEQRSLIP
ncbi:hypothetical protein ACUN7Z_00655 [Vreelandella venusta]|uniref:hypothetical protein n=1 Tax=Vreelandella venusta TaxID=44935 RepID=UPI004044F1A3